MDVYKAHFLHVLNQCLSFPGTICNTINRFHMFVYCVTFTWCVWGGMCDLHLVCVGGLILCDLHLVCVWGGGDV